MMDYRVMSSTCIAQRRAALCALFLALWLNRVRREPKR